MNAAEPTEEIPIDIAEPISLPADPSRRDWAAAAKAIRLARNLAREAVSQVAVLKADLDAAFARIRALELDAALAAQNLTPARRAILRRIAQTEKPNGDVTAWIETTLKGI